MDGIAAVYADGGVVLKNPSRLAGTFGCCWVDALGYRVASASGFVTPAEIGLPAVTNNYAELLALVCGLERLPNGWSGAAYSDSLVTLNRCRGRGTQKGVPDGLWRRLWHTLGRLGKVEFVLLGGHPTVAELAAGVMRDGLPCSRHNVYCDEMCRAEAKRFLKCHAGPDGASGPVLNAKG